MINLAAKGIRAVERKFFILLLVDGATNWLDRSLQVELRADIGLYYQRQP
jgi:hypothetical protein